MKRLFVCLAVGLMTVGAFAQWSNPADDIPAYHSQPPATNKKLSPILSGKQLTGPYFTHAFQVRAYKEAAKIPKVLYQLPCYCRCDRSLGHTSLHSCFSGLHAAECSTCMKEGVYAYRMTMKGKSVQQIREGIEKGEFEKIDLTSNGM
ncbi:MAG: CYCXC family (seleno)protein [Acidobacteriaceae bacterium]